jgi:hypothetical protein
VVTKLTNTMSTALFVTLLVLMVGLTVLPSAMITKTASAQQDQQHSSTTAAINSSGGNTPVRIVRQTKYSDLPEAVPASIADELERVNKDVAAQVANHTGWAATISWTDTKVTVNYVGPADKDPGHYVRGVGHPAQLATQSAQKQQSETVQPFSILSVTQLDSESISAHDYSGSSFTSAYKIEQALNAKKSSVSSIDYLVNHNGWNGNDAKWMQDGFMFDNAGITVTETNKWVANWDVYDSSGNEDPSYPVDSVIPGTVTVGDTIGQDITAIGSGMYTMAVTDANTGNGSSRTYSAGDSVNHLNLFVNSGGLVQDSGTQAETLSTGSTKFHWGDPFFAFVFWHTSTFTGDSTCNSFYSPEPANGGSNPITTSTSTGSSCIDDMNYP